MLGGLIYEKGEFVRGRSLDEESQSSLKEKALQEGRELTQAQDSEPDENPGMSAEKKAAIRRKLLGDD